MYFVGDFLKKVPHTPQKLPDNLFLYRVYRPFSTDGSVGQTGPQLPVENIVASGARHGLLPRLLIFSLVALAYSAPGGARPPSQFAPVLFLCRRKRLYITLFLQSLIYSFISHFYIKTKNPAVGSWGPIAGNVATRRKGSERTVQK